MNKLENIIGRHLRNYRKEMKISQIELADILNISQSYLGYLERGEKKPSRELLLVISDKLNISIDKLLSDDSEYSFKQTTNELVERIQTFPRKERDMLHTVIEIFLSITKENKP